MECGAFFLPVVQYLCDMILPQQHFCGDIVPVDVVPCRCRRRMDCGARINRGISSIDMRSCYSRCCGWAYWYSRVDYESAFCDARRPPICGHDS